MNREPANAPCKAAGCNATASAGTRAPNGAVPSTFSGILKCGVIKINMLTLVLHNWLPKESLHSESHHVPRQEVQLFSASGYSPAFSLYKTEGVGGVRESGLLGGLFPLFIIMHALPSARTGFSAGLEAEAFVTRLALGFWEVHCNMQDRTPLPGNRLCFTKSVLKNSSCGSMEPISPPWATSPPLPNVAFCSNLGDGIQSRRFVSDHRSRRAATDSRER